MILKIARVQAHATNGLVAPDGNHNFARRLWAVSIPIFSLREPFEFLILADGLCFFGIQSPVSYNECMHHTGKFVSFVCDLLFYLCIPFFGKMLPAHGGKHDF